VDSRCSFDTETEVTPNPAACAKRRRPPHRSGCGRGRFEPHARNRTPELRAHRARRQL